MDLDPLIVLLIGMAVVVGGVLWLRLHAFVALIGADPRHAQGARGLLPRGVDQHR